MKQIRKVLEYVLGEGMSQAKTSRALGVARSAVADYVKRASVAGISWPLDESISDKEIEDLLFPKSTIKKGHPQPDWNYIHNEMKRRGATLMVLHEEYLEEHPNGMRYRRFCQLYKKFKKTLPVSMRQVHLAGEKIFVDYAGHTVDVVVPETGETRKAQVFVGTLGASNYCYAEATWDQTLPSWIGSHVRMFDYFGGTARYLVPDNLKSAVTVAGWRALVLNRTYQDMADHYRIIVEPTRPGKPKDKGAVEKSVQIVERWILFRLRKQTFFGLSELNMEISRLLEELNTRKTKKIPTGRKQLFEDLEKSAMKQLPGRPYEFAAFRTQRVQTDYTVNIDGHAYSVPYTYVGRSVDIRLTERMLEVLCDGQRIASHPRSGIQGGATISEAHMPENHKKIREWSVQKLVDVAGFVGDGASQFIEHLKPEELTEIGRYKTGTRLVSLSNEYPADRINAACLRAVEIKAHSIEQVENILKNNLDKLSGSSSRLDDGLSDHENIRGGNYYH